MTITIAPELQARVLDAAHAKGSTIGTYDVKSEPPVLETDPEFEDVRAAVLEGLEQARRGESRPADEVFAELRAKYAIPGTTV